MTEAPVLRVVSGEPDDAELAAVVAVLLASAARPAPRPSTGASGLWGHPATLVRPGGQAPGGWVAPRL